MKQQSIPNLQGWILDKLETLKDSPSILVRDPLSAIPIDDRQVRDFALGNGFNPLWASTNLSFRNNYEEWKADSGRKKLLVIDQAPEARTISTGIKAPPPFYPDFLALTPLQARLQLDLRNFLREITGDADWPHEVNEPRYARLIMRHLDGVLEAHANLRAIGSGRFTDQDFRKIVAFAALGVAGSAFKKLGAGDYWKIGLLGHEALEELDNLAPDVTATIKDELRRAPAPFCWLADRDPDTVIRAFYLAVILNQHFTDWKPLVSQLDPSLIRLTDIEPSTLQEASNKLVELDPAQAHSDLDNLERSFDHDALQFLLVERLKLNDPGNLPSIIERERFSGLIRSLSLLLALENLLVSSPERYLQPQLYRVLFPEGKSDSAAVFVENRLASSQTWSDLKEAYRLAHRIQVIRAELNAVIKQLRVKRGSDLTFRQFREWWNEKQLNRLEYYLSALDRIVNSSRLMDGNVDDFPVLFSAALDNVKSRVRMVTDEVSNLLKALNIRFQEMAQAQYPTWVGQDTEVCLTSHFLRRCLKPHWDPQNEKAVVFVFDGMRYDIWDELLRPLLEERLELVEDYTASALIPSETHLSRWAIAAGQEPAAFWPRRAESEHLGEGLNRTLGYSVLVETLTPEGAGTGETVRYRAGNLEYYIFEFCDKALHSIKIKKYDDGREVPTRPLAYVYQQQLKDLIEKEVMAIVRKLAPGTKLFITSDHGFGPVAREKLWFESADLNRPEDCNYLNALLRVPVEQALLHNRVRENIISFTPTQLGLYEQETISTKSGSVTRQYGAVVFPKVGYAFSRSGSPFNPDAYSHGGISIQELMVPMVVMKLKPPREGLVSLDPIGELAEVLEGEEVEFRLRLSLNRKMKEGEEVPVEVEANFSNSEASQDDFTQAGPDLPKQLLYLSARGGEAIFRFKIGREHASDKEHRQERLKRLLTISINYREGRRIVRKNRSFPFTVQLKSEKVIRRVPASLGSILGLSPRKS